MYTVEDQNKAVSRTRGAAVSVGVAIFVLAVSTFGQHGQLSNASQQHKRAHKPKPAVAASESQNPRAD